MEEAGKSLYRQLRKIASLFLKQPHMNYRIGHLFTKLLKVKRNQSQVQLFKLNNGTEYIVESGLMPGDVIIAEGAGLVREGTVIESQPTK